MEYWLDLSYCAQRGMRMIRPRWLAMSTENGDIPVDMIDIGAVRCQISVDGEPRLVPTASVIWISAGDMKVARITKKNTPISNDSGKRVPGTKLLHPGALAAVLDDTDSKLLYVYCKGAFGYIPRANVELLDIDAGEYPSALVSVNGRTAGTVQAEVRPEPGKGESKYKLVVGTPVTVLEQKGDYYYLEGGGVRGWLKYTQLALDETEAPE